MTLEKQLKKTEAEGQAAAAAAAAAATAAAAAAAYTPSPAAAAADSSSLQQELMRSHAENAALKAQLAANAAPAAFVNPKP